MGGVADEAGLKRGAIMELPGLSRLQTFAIMFCHLLDP